MNHRDEALRLLDAAKTYGVASAARSALLAEAQIHAFLAATAPPEAPASPSTPPATRRRAPKKPTEAAE